MKKIISYALTGIAIVGFVVCCATVNMPEVAWKYTMGNGLVSLACALAGNYLDF